MNLLTDDEKILSHKVELQSSWPRLFIEVKDIFILEIEQQIELNQLINLVLFQKFKPNHQFLI